MTTKLAPAKTAEDQWRDKLRPFVPRPSLGYVARCMSRHAIALKVTPHRKTKYGDYRPSRHYREPHQISVNGDLMPERFLWTLIHELAHLFTHIHFGPEVKSHGHEWRHCFNKLMQPLLREEVFPKEILPILSKHLHSAKATSCSDLELHRAFLTIEGHIITLLTDLPIGALFQSEDGRHFVKLEKRRTRYLCKEMGTRKKFLVHGGAEVTHLDM